VGRFGCTKPWLGFMGRDDPNPHSGGDGLQSRKQRGEVHGIAKAHSAVATVTYVAFGLAVASVTIKF
jgi:hypothetical protein